MRNGEIFFDTLDCGHVRFEFSSHFDEKVESLRDCDRQRDRETDKTRTERITWEDGKKRRQCSDQICNLI